MNVRVITERVFLAANSIIFWLQTSLIKLRSAIPLINLVYNILREPLGILGIFVSHVCCRRSLSTLISSRYHVDHDFYFYYRQKLHLNNIIYEIAKCKYICFYQYYIYSFVSKNWYICYYAHIICWWLFVVSSQMYLISLNVITQLVKPEIYILSSSHSPFCITQTLNEPTSPIDHLLSRLVFLSSYHCPSQISLSYYLDYYNHFITCLFSSYLMVTLHPLLENVINSLPSFKFLQKTCRTQFQFLSKNDLQNFPGPN